MLRYFLDFCFIIFLGSNLSAQQSCGTDALPAQWAEEFKRLVAQYVSDHHGSPYSNVCDASNYSSVVYFFTLVVTAGSKVVFSESGKMVLFK